MPKDDPISIKLKKDRGENITILGGISNRWERLMFTLGSSTSLVSVEDFLHHIAPHIE